MNYPEKKKPKYPKIMARASVNPPISPRKSKISTLERTFTDLKGSSFTYISTYVLLVSLINLLSCC